MAGSDTLVLGTRKGTLLFERSGAGGWKLDRHAHLGTPVPYAFHDARTGTLWASLDHGHWGQKLERSANGGRTWEPAAVPKYPQDATYNNSFPGMDDKWVPATLRYLWVLAPGGADRPNRLYAGTEPGGLFRSEDNGESWELVKSLWDHPSRAKEWFGGGRDAPGIHSVVVDPYDSRHVFVGISCAGVFETKDDGETWSPRNAGLKAEFLPNPEAEVGHDPHLLTACAGAPQVMWQQNHCGLFRSTDSSGSWTKISQDGGPAHFGFAIAADERDPGTAWVVPAMSDEKRVAIAGALCVCRTEDGGENWEALRTGLPQENSFDVVFRHALDASGDRIAFGTTSGNAFLSEDRGESWQCLGNYLPPIYSVRFAAAI